MQLTDQVKTYSPDRCPICNKDNQCGNVKTCSSNEDCWCMDEEINFSDTLLSKTPKYAKNKACICKACALSHIDL